MVERIAKTPIDRTQDFLMRSILHHGLIYDERTPGIYHSLRIKTNWGSIQLEVPKVGFHEQLEHSANDDALQSLQETLAAISKRSYPQNSLHENTPHTHTMQFIMANWSWLNFLFCREPVQRVEPQIHPEVLLDSFGAADLVGCSVDGNLHIIEIGKKTPRKEAQLQRYNKGAHLLLPGVNGNLALTVGHYETKIDFKSPRIRIRLEQTPVNRVSQASVGPLRP